MISAGPSSVGRGCIIGKKKTVTSSDPWKPAQPFILGSLASTQATYNANQPQLQKYANMEQDTYGRLAPGAEAGITGAQSLVNATLAGKYLGGNPNLQGIIDRTNRDVTDNVNGQFGLAGRYGSGMHAGVLASKLADADNQLRYQDYSAERGYQNAAIGQASNLMAGSQSLLNNSADLPWVGTAALSGGIRQSSNGYGTTTQSSSGGLLDSLLGAGATLGGAAITKSDARVKDINQQVGITPDGLPLYSYTYKDDPAKTPQIGPVAQEVEQIRPDASGPTLPDGTKTVDYARLGLPDPSTMAAGGANAITPQALPRISDGIGAYGLPTADSMTGGGPNQLGPQILPKVKDPNSGALGLLGRALNPDTSTVGGSLTMLGHSLLASGGPTAGLGAGLVGLDQQRATDKKDAARQALETAQTAAALAASNKDQITAAGNGIYATSVDGVTRKVADVDKDAPLPPGMVRDPATGVITAMPGFLLPADELKAKQAADDARQKASDARQAATFAHSDAAAARSQAHSDAMQARSLAAIAARTGPNGTTAPLPDATVEYLAGRYNATGGELPQLGFGKAGGAMKAAIINRAVQLETAAGHTGADSASAQVAFGGQKAAARTTGNMGAKIDYGVNELHATIPLALQASANVPRGSFMPYTKVVQAIQAGNSDPRLKDFAVKTQAALNAYNMVAARGGSSVGEREHNATLIRTADSPEAYKAALNAMQQEGEVAKGASRQTMNDISGRTSRGSMPFKAGGGKLVTGKDGVRVWSPN